MAASVFSDTRHWRWHIGGHREVTLAVTRMTRLGSSQCVGGRLSVLKVFSSSAILRWVLGTQEMWGGGGS